MNAKKYWDCSCLDAYRCIDTILDSLLFFTIRACWHQLNYSTISQTFHCLLFDYSCAFSFLLLYWITQHISQTANLRWNAVFNPVSIGKLLDWSTLSNLLRC